MKLHSACAALSFFLLSFAAFAQDTRTVKEPVVPNHCARVAAELTAANGNLNAADEKHLDTGRIQKAIDACQAGQAVELISNGPANAFLSGPLQLRTGVTLLVAQGVTLFGSRNPRDFDIDPGSCGTVTAGKGHGCKPMISGSDANDSGVMGPGTIDGRGGAKLLGQNVSWWDLAQEAKVTNKNQNCPRILILNRCNNFILYNITLKNSPNFHVSYNMGNGFTAWGVIIDSPKTARNTDGIDPANSTNVTITHCYIHTGDDQVAVKAGGTVPSTNISIVHSHFYTGHGMSIGSETDSGANHIFVSDLTIDGADNGIRIKSNSTRGGLVENVTYDDVCIRDTKNPIYMDTNYTAGYSNQTGKLPVFRNIALRNVHILGGGKITLEGYDAAHRLQMNFDDVTANGPITVSAKHGEFILGPGLVSVRITGEDIQVNGKTGKSGKADSCAGRFVPLPQSPMPKTQDQK
ncbi:MAG TPA: glycosyl hydrolase family 28 protein [Bryobacteraceae bacterium]|nr:glycosyl hydrolase family 28 protein [Bryobacteraceae bacterium]